MARNTVQGVHMRLVIQSATRREEIAADIKERAADIRVIYKQAHRRARLRRLNPLYWLSILLDRLK